MSEQIIPRPYSGNLVESLMVLVEEALSPAPSPPPLPSLGQCRAEIPEIRYDLTGHSYKCSGEAVVTDLDTERALCRRCFDGR